MMRIGIDVGGTNTDAVLLDGGRVVAKCKTPTTADVSTGITRALETLLKQQRPVDIRAIMIGTTHFVNAVIEQRDLAEVAAVRLCLPAGEAVPPRTDWPSGVRQLTGPHTFFAHGGREFDGRPLSPLDPQELRQIGQEIARRGLRQIAVTGIFSTLQAEDERRAGRALSEVVPGAQISLSHQIGRTGLLERENATLLNASLRPLAEQTISAFERALEQLNLKSALYLTQNDGTIMRAAFAREFPVLTFASGPTNSMRGAAYLSGLKDGIVVDIGGTTTDVGALINGFPREASVAVRVGGVRTNFRMPDVLSIGLGGGSLVTAGGAKIGPLSVGHRLTQEALSFGGPVLTASDIAIARGFANFAPQRPQLDPETVTRASEAIKKMVEEAIDRMKIARGAVPVILVGGGSVLVDDQIQGAAAVYRPAHFEAANAVGAAIAQISGEVDRVYELTSLDRTAALADAKRQAIERAVAAGAQPETVEIVDVFDVPLAYLPSQATRVHVKAVGDA
ncbi:MAG: hydantoinase/oxoprolinase family protein [Ardenticatenaceae bacterium]|nr:hydantoinase/oxoprolinase family protein [Ardenticatenaceae bacterium]